ncbi:flagellar basal-body MS-ring/collar protein FliF [Undibacterium arcticum]|uniref:Flagellar M-ring protein n=1 Tax=Undibacterium arcticum TaxID=1762892 RepID=A0ABV7F745_9BURK
MAVAEEGALVPRIAGFAQKPGGRNFLLALGAAAVMAVMAGVWMWSQQPEYRVLFANFNDRDGGAIVASLQQMNVPYKYAEGGGAILVPANQVFDARLKLAAQGLPKGGNVGFELMENQKLGVSQFLEQVNFQRALEGELARSIQSVGAIQAARVHLALPKPSVFVRDQQKPTASVLLNLHPGRTLDTQQVSAIVHLVASSVPDLPPSNVTIVDQSGNLLSESGKAPGAKGLDPSQLKYVQQLQQNIVQQIESIITPIVGLNNVRAEATADVDFSNTEQAAETYKPNQTPTTSSVRSQQTSESQNSSGGNASGIPGALSNQPPAPATAPLTAPASAQANASGTNTPINTRKDSTVNYEVDKTIRYTQQPMGGIRRLSVAVVVNYKREIDKNGKVTTKALTDTEKAQITDLVKEAMGFNKDRGDSINVVNSPFASSEKENFIELPLWKQPDNIALAKEAGKYLIAAIVLLYLFFRVLKPMLRRLTHNLNTATTAPALNGAEPNAGIGSDGQLLQDDLVSISGYQKNLGMAKELARSDPRIVANVIKTWVGSNE